MLQLRASFAVLAVTVAGSAFAAGPMDVQTVQAFQMACADADYEGFCIGYITGISSVMEAINTVDPSLAALTMCLGGEPATVGARVQAFKNWAAKHPEKWSEHAFFGVVEAMRETWPCSKSPN